MRLWQAACISPGPRAGPYTKFLTKRTQSFYPNPPGLPTWMKRALRERTNGHDRPCAFPILLIKKAPMLRHCFLLPWGISRGFETLYLPGRPLTFYDKRGTPSRLSHRAFSVGCPTAI